MVVIREASNRLFRDNEAGHYINESNGAEAEDGSDRNKQSNKCGVNVQCTGQSSA